MIFNMLKKANRSYIDKGDLKSYIFKLYTSNPELDKLTLIAMINIIDLLDARFDLDVKPIEDKAYPYELNEYYLNNSIKKTCKANKSLIKKNKKQKGASEEVVDFDDPIEAPIPINVFTNEQLNQFQELLLMQNKDIQKVIQDEMKKILVKAPAKKE